MISGYDYDYDYIIYIYIYTYIYIYIYIFYLSIFCLFFFDVLQIFVMDPPRRPGAAGVQ